MLQILWRILFILFAIDLAAQNSFYYPNSFNAYFLNFSQITPAYFPEEGKVELTSGYKSLTGAFRKISSYNFTAARIFKKNENSHLARLQFYNEKEGSYISSPRAYANYGYQVSLNENLKIVSGVSLGFAGLYYSAPNTTQSSFNVPDGSLGVSLKSDWIEIGASAFQIFNSSFKPLKSTVTLERYYNLHASLKKEWSSDWFVKAYGLYRILPSAEPDIIITGSIGYTRNIEAGMSVKYGNGISLFGVFSPEIGEDRLKILINYNSPLFSLVPKYQSNIEIGLAYLVFDKVNNFWHIYE